MIVTCDWCGKEAKKSPRQIRRTKRKFCSRECRFFADRIKVDKTCKVCGTRFQVRPSESRKYSTCSKPCYLTAKAKGNNGNWRGGITRPRNVELSTAKYRAWRLHVFERDDFTCVDCGKRGGNMEADHIKPWAYFPDLRYSLDNGATRCRNCHKKRTAETFRWRKSLMENGQYTWEGPKPKVARTISCAECGKMFTPRVWNGKFCSQPCKWRACARRRPRILVEAL